MNRGFTLIELIIYLAIVSALVTSLILWSLSIGNVGARARGGAELNASGRFALEIITRDIEQATALVVPAGATPSSTLTLTNALGEAVTISILGGQLMRTVGGGSPLALTARPAVVTNFTVARATGPWSARPTLTVTFILGALSAPARSFTTVANLRH
mgnify:CR=1 FL=1